MNVIFYNKIEEKINEYIEKTGSSKIWIAKQMGISKQALYSLMKSSNPYIIHLIKLAVILNCKVEDLYYYDIVK